MYGKMNSIFSRSVPARCEEFKVTGASADLAKQVPLSPKHDFTHDYKAHQWGYEKVSDGQTKGQKAYSEGLDALNHQVAKSVIPTDSRGFHADKANEDRINTSYEHMLADEMSLVKVPATQFESAWQKKLAYLHGLYVPSSFANAKTSDDVRISVSDFTDKMKHDDPKDACKYLAVEEMRCLQVYQYEKDSAQAAKRCVKWHSEHAKCLWDQHKFNNGYTFIETTTHDKKRRPYLFYPDFKYA